MDQWASGGDWLFHIQSSLPNGLVCTIFSLSGTTKHLCNHFHVLHLIDPRVALPFMKMDRLKHALVKCA